MALLKGMGVLTSPCREHDVRALKLGQQVQICGSVIAARDCVHRHLAQGGASPVSLAGAIVYHCGPSVIRRGAEWIVRSAGPTTSLRQEPYMADVIRRTRIRAIVGKGGMGSDTQKACAQYGCVYLQAVGGAGGKLAQCVQGVDAVHFVDQFGLTEAMWELRVDGLDAVVTIDARGRSLYRRVLSASRKSLQHLLNTSAGITD